MTANPDSETSTSERKTFSTSTRISLGFLAGIGTGLFFGDYCQPLGAVGTAFVNLLQMTVLPYIAVAILLRLGTLSRTRLWPLVRAAGGVMIFFWVLVAVLVVVLPAALPAWEAGSYFSPSLTESPQLPGLMEQIFQPNLFRSLAEGAVPAIVLFCIVLGIALSQFPNADQALSLLTLAERVLLSVNGAVLRLMPFGVFAITAHSAGTLDLQEASRIQAYLALQAACALLICAGLMPLLIATVTPLSYREVVLDSRAILITALATGKVLAVLPLIIATAERLLRNRRAADDESVTSIEAVIPLAYSFPHFGGLTALLFIPFCAWFLGQPMSAAEYPQLLGGGFLAVFGSPVAAIPWLLDAHQLPSDMFQLFLASAVICGPLADMTGSMYLYGIAVITPCVLSGTVRVTWPGIAAAGASSALLVLAAVGATRTWLSLTLPNPSAVTADQSDRNSPLALRSFVVHRAAPEQAADLSRWTSRMDRIEDTEVLRVGYLADNIPFSWFNAEGELVGFDVDMGNLLAEDLGVAAEFVPFHLQTLSSQLNRGDIDVAMSGIGLTPGRLLHMSLTDSYLESTLAFVVPDHQRRRFASAATVQAMPSLRVAVVDSVYFERRVRDYLPQAVVKRIDSPREFFETDEFDALVISAEAGSAWTIEYPSFSVAIPHPHVLTSPLVYAVPAGDHRTSDVVSRWITLKRDTLLYERLYDYWILGKDSAPRKPRWCILRDVLHWVP